MNTYVVGVLNFFDNEICLKKIEAENEMEALKQHSNIVGYDFSNCSTLEDMYVELFNADMTASILQI